jgi:Maintenance of mitochondrial morphology protein 1
LFLKPNAICLSRKDAENGSLKPNSIAQSRESGEKPKKHHPPENSYFLFPTTNIEKEDWYFALLRGAKAKSGSQKSLSPTDPTVAAIPARFDPRNMFSLIQTIHSTDAQLQTRWLNALVGRIFLATYQTKHIEEVCIRKITKKIARVNRPAFLSDIKVQKVVVGTQAPVFTQPRLKELSAAGEFAADVNVSYNGGFRIEIATVATLQLGSRFKPRQVSLSLAVTVKKLEGKLLLRIKKPPSNRIWVGFYETPTMDLAIEPIVSSRQITYTMVLRAIESRIREAVWIPVTLFDCSD